MRHRNTSPAAQEAPQSPVSPSPTVDPSIPDAPDEWAAEFTLAELDRVPRSELADGDARDALAEAIKDGAVIGVYTPFGCPTHVIELGWLIPGERRRPMAAWLAAWEMTQRMHALTPVLDFLAGKQPVEGGA